MAGCKEKPKRKALTLSTTVTCFEILAGVLVLLTLATSPSAAQAVRVRGQVLAAEGGPLAGAVVEAFPWTSSCVPPVPSPTPAATGTTSENGFFTVSVARPGRYRWNVRAPARAPVRLEPVDVTASTTLPPARLAPAAVLTVDVRVDGTPVSEAWVGLCSQETRHEAEDGEEEKRWQSDPQLTLTDASGRVRFAVAGRAVVEARTAERSGHAEVSGEGPETVTLTLRPGEPAVIPCLGGRPEPEDVILEGQVVDPRGNGIAGARVRAIAEAFREETRSKVEGGEIEGPEEGAEVETAADGYFVLPLPPRGSSAQSTLLDVEHPGFRRRIVNVSEEAAEGNPLLIELRPGLQAHGRVLGPEGEPVPKARVIVLHLVPTARGGAMTLSDEDGRFHFEGLTPGTVQVRATSVDYLPEEGFELTLELGEEVPEIEIVLRQGAQIRGRVSSASGKPLAGARVSLLDNGEASSWSGVEMPSAVTDEDGRYELNGVVEGQRSLMAEHPDFVRARRRVAVTDESTRVNFRLTGGTLVSGQVVTSNGEPIREAEVSLIPIRTGEAPRPVKSGSDGAFSFPAVGEGAYHLVAEKTGYAASRTEREVRVSDGEEVPLQKIVLDAGGLILGQVLGIPSYELPQVRVTAVAPGLPGKAVAVEETGDFQISLLGPGTWTVFAHAPDGRREASTEVTLQRGEKAFVELDLNPQE